MINTTLEEKVFTIRPIVSMVMANSDALKNTIKESVLTQKKKDGDFEEVVIDLTGVELMDSTGVGVLITLKKFAEEQGYALRLKNPNPMIKRVLTITKMDEYFGGRFL